MRSAGSIAILVCLILGAAICCSRQSPGSPGEDKHAAIQKIADAVAKKLEVGDVEGVYDILRDYWEMPVEELTLGARHHMQWHQAISPRFGKVVGVEYLGKEQIGESLVRFSYLEKFERHAVLWAFDFYYSGGKWKFDNVIASDEVFRLFEFSHGPQRK